jgi:hypothetical protein
MPLPDANEILISSELELELGLEAFLAIFTERELLRLLDNTAFLALFLLGVLLSSELRRVRRFSGDTS